MKKKQMKDVREILQWHPAFYAGIQIEFEEETRYLEFKQEYPLGTKPKQIDVLIIKKETDRVLRKNIGRIFRKHNIIEYKGPGDYLGIDDFYKVYGYTCFYKANVKTVNSIKFEELTISLVSERYPKELIRHLEEERGLEVRCIESGIYYVIGEMLPIQIIVTGNLSERENLWLRNLTNRMENTESAERLLKDYTKHKHDERYESMLEIIMRANEEKFKEVKKMCKALEELMKEELEEKRHEGEECVNKLILKLSELGRMDDIIKSAADKEYQEKLFKEFGL